MQLSALQTLETSGMPSPHARAVVKAVDMQMSAYLERFATKEDLELQVGLLRSELKVMRGEMQAGDGALRGEMQAMEDRLRGEMQAMESRLRGEMKAMRGELQGEMKAMRGEMGGGMQALEARLEAAMARNHVAQMRWTLTVMVSQTGMLIGGAAAVLHFFGG